MILFCKRFHCETIYRLIHDHALLKEATFYVFFFSLVTLLLEFEGTCRLFVGLNQQLNVRDGPLFFWRGGVKNPEKNCLQKQKRPNKLFADMKRKR